MESEGKHKEAKAARAERASAEKDAEARRMKAAADKNRRAAELQQAALAGPGRGWHRRRLGLGGLGLEPFDHHAMGAHVHVPGGGAAGQAARPGPAGNPRQAGGGGRRAARAERHHAAAAAEAAAQAAAQAGGAPGHVLGGVAGAAAVPGAGAPQNNANHFGNLLQHRNGALHVDPNALQQTANEMGVPAAQLFQMMFQA